MSTTISYEVISQEIWQISQHCLQHSAGYLMELFSYVNNTKPRAGIWALNVDHERPSSELFNIGELTISFLLFIQITTLYMVRGILINKSDQDLNQYINSESSGRLIAQILNKGNR